MENRPRRTLDEPALPITVGYETRLRQAYVAATLSGMLNLETRVRRSLRRRPRRLG